jgi:NAD(P)-dependent dehydrogenase (short-subunit alcohol dehydrogenase family)
MSTATAAPTIERTPELRRQTVVVIGGSAGTGPRDRVGPGDVAALVAHLMSNSALTGATYDIDGGQQFVSR